MAKKIQKTQAELIAEKRANMAKDIKKVNSRINRLKKYFDEDSDFYKDIQTIITEKFKKPTKGGLIPSSLKNITNDTLEYTEDAIKIIAKKVKTKTELFKAAELKLKESNESKKGTNINIPTIDINEKNIINEINAAIRVEKNIRSKTDIYYDLQRLWEDLAGEIILSSEIINELNYYILNNIKLSNMDYDRMLSLIELLEIQASEKGIPIRRYQK